MNDQDILDKISEKINDPLWLAGIEQQIISHVQDRITARFAHATTMPDIISAIKYNVATLFQEGYIPDLKNYVDPALIRSTVEHAVSTMIDRTIDNLVMDPVWLTRVENMLKQQMVLKVLDNFSNLDFEQVVREQIDIGIQKWQDRLRENFSSRGIKDLATDTCLTVTDEGIVASHGIAAKEILIEGDSQFNGTVVVDKLAVLSGMNTDAPGWQPLIDNISSRTLDQINKDWRQDLVGEVLDLARTEGIEFSQVLIDGIPIFEGDQLNSAIKITNIERVGVLKELRVHGAVNLNDSVNVINKRLGINTDSPEMALSVWDEEVSLVAGKLSKDRAYIGTGRGQSLTIGINRVPQIEITADGLTTIKQICIGRHRISHADQVPGGSGTRGDIVFNSNPRPGEPFAWQCLGGFQWQPLRTA